MAMIGQFISIEVDLLDTALAVESEIERVLARWQTCLCWFVSEVDLHKQEMVVDAVVLDQDDQLDR